MEIISPGNKISPSYLLIVITLLALAGQRVLANCPSCGPNIALGNYCSQSKLGIYKKYSVSTDSKPCATIARKILERGGNAADSTVAALICMTVTTPESMGLGGGSVITVYNAKTRQTTIIDARETAPSAAFEDLYRKSGHSSSVDGPLAIAVPGALAGFWHLFKNHGSGRVKWPHLFTQSINLCEKGFRVDDYMAKALNQTQDMILKHKEMKDIFVNKRTNRVLRKGELLVQKQLGKTLTRLAKSRDPVRIFYQKIAHMIVRDIERQRGWPTKPIITVRDFMRYSIVLRKPVVKQFKNFNNLTLHSFPLPGSGYVLSFILNVMQRFPDLYPSGLQNRKTADLFWHRLVETYKYASAQRNHLGDPAFDKKAITIGEKLNSDEFAEQTKRKIDDKKTFCSDSNHYDHKSTFFSEDHGTSHVAVIDGEGNAVSVTSSINLYFGSRVMSPSTGIMLNNEMDDFNTGFMNEFGIPPSDSNRIRPGKRPFSSMCPSIFTDNSGVRLVIGASGGPKITTSVALVAIRHLFFGQNIKQAIDGQRIHHQLYPNKICYEKCFPKNSLNGLFGKGHGLHELNQNDIPSNVVAISRLNGKLYANSDYRKGGTCDGI